MNIKFPVQPYSIQVELAETLYKALESEVKLCFMQSPTGTGKSYSLLVGLCSWLQKNRFATDTKNKVGSGVPSWIKKASSVMEQGQMKSQQHKLEDRLNKIHASDITVFKVKSIGAKKDAKAKKDQIDDEHQFVDSECDELLNGKRKLQLKILQQEQRIFNRPRIIFTSRTHSQLTQIVQSFNKLNSDLICLSLASKQHMCVNQLVKSSADVDNNCTKLLQKGGCSYYTKDSFKQFMNVSVVEAATLGDKNSVCAYYGSKNLMDVADIICVPYSSILNKGIRDRLGISLQNSIVVFDEGHNIVEFDLNSLGVELKYKSLCSLNARLDAYLSKYGDRIKCKSKFTFGRIQKLICDTLAFLKKKCELNVTKQSYTKFNFTDFLIQLNSKEIEIHKLKTFIEINNLSNRLFFIKGIDNNTNDYESRTLMGLISFFQTIIFNNDENSIVLVKYSQTSVHQTVIKTMVFEATSVKQVVKLSKMTVFAGGTLHPLSQLQEVKSSYASVISKEFDHVIPNENCQVYIIESFNKLKLTFTYKNKQGEQHLNVIKNMVKKISSTQKQGIIVFVQSYKYLQLVRSVIKKQSFYSICHFDQKQNSKVFETYQKAIKNKQPAILFSVMGGRLSEGINFSDQLARALIIFGLPYSDLKAPEVAERMAYYDKFGKNLTGKDYYENLCMRIVNQTVGRAIRHRNDKAKIYLVDERFTRSIGKLSKWLRSRCITIPDGSLIQ